MKKKQVTTQKHYSPRDILVAIGAKIRALKLLHTVEELVKIRQMTVKYSPVQKLMDGLITILAGGARFISNQHTATERSGFAARLW